MPDFLNSSSETALLLYKVIMFKIFVMSELRSIFLSFFLLLIYIWKTVGPVTEVKTDIFVTSFGPVSDVEMVCD